MTHHDYSKHVSRLVTENKVELFLLSEAPRDEACSDIHPDGVRRAIFAHTIDDDTSYAVVLHELGHHLAEHGRMTAPKTLARLCNDKRLFMKVMLAEERAAWRWAEANALEWTIGMECVKRTCMMGYEREAA